MYGVDESVGDGSNRGSLGSFCEQGAIHMILLISESSHLSDWHMTSHWGTSRQPLPILLIEAEVDMRPISHRTITDRVSWHTHTE